MPDFDANMSAESEIDAAIIRLYGALHRNPESLTNHQLQRIVEFFSTALLRLDERGFDEAFTCDAPRENFGYAMAALGDSPLVDDILGALPPITLGQLLLKFPLTQDGLDTGSLDRHLAVDVADAIGPDWGQTWYRFICLVTKLA